MNLSEFRIGGEFRSGEGVWRCTDIGSRVVVAMRLDNVSFVRAADDIKSDSFVQQISRAEAEANGWFNGPPYAVAERVFDENDQMSCSPK